MQVKMYEVFYDDKSIGAFSREELSNVYNLSPEKIDRYANEGLVYQKHYSFKRVADYAEKKRVELTAADKKWMKEWDETTAILKRRSEQRKEKLCS